MRRLLTVLAVFCLAAGAQAVPIHRYVNTDADADGDGTTSSTTSVDGTHAYNTLSAWEVAEQCNLTDDTGDQMFVHCTGATTDTLTCFVSGWTTSPSSYISIQTDAPSRHSGTWDLTKYHLSVGGTDVAALRIGENYVNVVGMQLERTASNSSQAVVYVGNIDPGGSEINISYSLWKHAGHAANYEYGFQVSDADATINLWNTAGYGCGPAGTTLYMQTTATLTAYNCTFYGGSVGVNVGAGSGNTATLTNCLVGGTGANSYTGTFTASDYNSSDDATNTGGAHDRVTQTYTFADAANEDFHLQIADVGARDFGVSDPGSGLYSDDFELGARAGSWDIGADESSDATATATPTPTATPAGGAGLNWRDLREGAWR